MLVSAAQSTEGSVNAAMSIPATMTRAAYARYKGWDRAYVTRLAQAGRLVLTEDGKQVLVEESDRRIAESADPSKEGVRERFAGHRGETLARELALEPDATAAKEMPGGAAQERGAAGSPAAPAAETDSLMDVRRELIAEQAARARLLRQELEGRLVDRETVRRSIFEKARIARNALTGLADRLSTPLAAESSPVKVYDMLLAEFRRICDELADGEAERTRQ